MSDIKVSDKLLSWVLGCECEFKGVKFNAISFDCTTKQNGHMINLNSSIKVVSSPLSSDLRDVDSRCQINIHTFIHLAKIKAVDSDYSVIENHYATKIYNLMSKSDESIVTFCNCELNFNIGNILEALEWVAGKVGGEG